MSHLNRRSFLQTTLGSLSLSLGGSLTIFADENKPRRKLPVAAVSTVYTENSHTDVLVGKILQGWKQDGGAGPDLELVSLFTDQVPKNDLSRGLAKTHGFRITETIEEAITLGTGKVAVAGVLSIGEHGSYPYTPDTNQHMYPRRRFFDEITATFRKSGQVVPVFSDKHLGYAWKDAKHIYDTAREMKIPLMAGSSIPVAWRKPPLKLPLGCEMTEAVALGFGPLEAYGFHALEGLQCMVERRKGGESGVVSVQAVKGDAILQAEKEGLWSRDLLLAAAGREAKPDQPLELSKDAVFYLIEYRDGFKATVAMGSGLAGRFGIAARLRGQSKPKATWFQLQNAKPWGHFEHLLRAIEQMIHTGQPSYPVERTLLTTGILDAAMHSIAEKGKRLQTPELAVPYKPVDWTFAKGSPVPPL